MCATATRPETLRESPAKTVPVVRFTVKGEVTGPALAPSVGTPNRPYTIIYDGADLFIGCLTRLATAIGGKTADCSRA